MNENVQIVLDMATCVSIIGAAIVYLLRNHFDRKENARNEIRETYKNVLSNLNQTAFGHLSVMEAKDRNRQHNIENTHLLIDEMAILIDELLLKISFLKSETKISCYHNDFTNDTLLGKLESLHEKLTEKRGVLNQLKNGVQNIENIDGLKNVSEEKIYNEHRPLVPEILGLIEDFNISFSDEIKKLLR